MISFMTDYLALSVSTISFLHAWLLKEMVWKQHYDEGRIFFQAGYKKKKKINPLYDNPLYDNLNE